MKWERKSSAKRPRMGYISFLMGTRRDEQVSFTILAKYLAKCADIAIVAIRTIRKRILTINYLLTFFVTELGQRVARS